MLITFRLPLEQYSEIMHMLGGSTQAPIKEFKLSCRRSLSWRNKILHSEISRQKIIEIKVLNTRSIVI